MKKIYQQPLMAVRLPRVEASFLDHFVSTPGGEEDEFNSKQRMDADEEDIPVEDDPWTSTQHSLW